MNSPVFIVGCPRSGTSFLYHLLLSAGGFAEFRTQMNVYDVLEPIYGNLGNEKNKRAAMEEWLRSKAFRVSGLDAAQIREKVMAECHSAGDFLRIIMREIAHRQGVSRWIDSTPTNVPHMLRIAKDFPDATFIHIIRDPRDVALSLDRRGWSRPLPWDRKNSLLAAGLYWEWIVRLGRSYGRKLSERYMEVRYEMLVQQSREALRGIAKFLQQELNFETIQQASVGSVRNPLTSFQEELQNGQFIPVGRWKEKFPVEQLVEFEALIGNYMEEMGYGRSATISGNRGLPRIGKRALYAAFHECKQWAKVHTPLTRWMVNYSDILIDK